MSTESLDRPNSPTLQDLAQVSPGPGGTAWLGASWASWSPCCHRPIQEIPVLLLLALGAWGKRVEFPNL